MISVKTNMPRHAQSIDSKIHSRIYGNKRGWVFTPRKFQDLGSSAAIEVALRRLKAGGTIRQLARGIYDYPRQHPVLGLLNPTADAVARAISTRDGTRLQPSGGYASVLGLTGDGRAALFGYSRQEVDPRGYVDHIHLESQATGIDSPAALLGVWERINNPHWNSPEFKGNSSLQPPATNLFNCAQA